MVNFKFQGLIFISDIMQNPVLKKRSDGFYKSAFAEMNLNYSSR